MPGTITLSTREFAFLGFGFSVGAVVVVAIVVSTRAPCGHLQDQSKNYNRRREIASPNDSNDSYRSASPDGLQKRKTSDRIGRLRPEARMALRLESSMSKSLEDELHDSDAESAETPAEERDAVFQKRSESLTMIHQMVINEHAIERDSVTVRVPATSANMGPGYDCIGMALNVWSEVTVKRSDRFEITYSGDGKHDVPLDETNLIVSGLRAAFISAGKDVPPLRIHCDNSIPYARGMGSSSAAIVGGLIGGLVISGHRLPCWGSEELLQLACSIEGHPDNVAPAIYGGCQLGLFSGERWHSERVQLPPGIQVVLYVPDFTSKTSSARELLGDTVTRKDAAFTIGRAAWLVNALVTGNLDNLAVGCQDAMHQPQRGDAIYTYLNPVVKAAIEAGADASYLSGAGPTVAAITSGLSGDIFTQRAVERVDQAVATAMLEAARESGITGKVFITQPSDTGAHVLKLSPEFSHKCITYQ